MIPRTGLPLHQVGFYRYSRAESRLRFFAPGSRRQPFSTSSSSSASSVSERVAVRVAERNAWSTWHTHSFAEVWKFLSGKYEAPNTSLARLDNLPAVQAIKWSRLKESERPCLQVTWIGHSTTLVQLPATKPTKNSSFHWNVLTDPIFSDRCSPVSWAGPSRLTPAACQLAEFEIPVDCVVVSHNHYDHLDYPSIVELAQLSKQQRNPITFIVPLGLKDWFLSCHIPPDQVVELDWHESHRLDGRHNGSGGSCLDITALPMQHWSNRKGYDRDQSLWCGYRISSKDATEEPTNMNETHESNVLFVGDTGWFDGLYDIGRDHGPFDLAIIPIGAYAPRDFMKYQHVDPKEAVQLMHAVRSSKAVPIHWGTFRLTTEPTMEPIERLVQETEADGLVPEAFVPWCVGETVAVTN